MPEVVGVNEGVPVGDGVGFAVGEMDAVPVPLLVKVGVALGVVDLEAPVEKVVEGVGVAVRGQQAAAEVEPVELVVKPAPQEVHVESPVVAA